MRYISRIARIAQNALMFQKKSLGQNFLRSEKALSQITEAGDIQPGEDTVIEIGPGEGVLTDKILEKRPKNLVIIEKDDRLIPMLCEKFGLKASPDAENRYENDVSDPKEPVSTVEESGKTDKKAARAGRSTKIILIHKDTTEIESFSDLARGLSHKLSNKTDQTARVPLKAAAKSYKVIANIPYYITGLIIRQLFSQETLPEKIVLLMQKEVVDRIVSHGSSNEDKESLLSASIKFYGTPKKVAVVPKGAFVPAPTVDSAILLISDIKKPEPRLEKAYFEIIKKGFAHKRKRLAKNLEGVFSYDSKKWESVLAKMNIGTNARAEEISSETYARIAQQVLNDSF